MNLKLNVSKEAWSRWKDVIQHLAEPQYDFPASNKEEFSLFLRMFSGTGTTFRISRDRWKFVIDVLRIGNEIIDVVAITVIAHTIQDERHNGFVITKACRVHPNKDTKSPGSPELKWHRVTSGGEAYHHCCDKECIGPDRVNRRKLNWESARLNIIQKAFEQEVLELRRKHAVVAEDVKKLKQTNEKKNTFAEAQKLGSQVQKQSSQIGQIDKQLALHRRDAARYLENNRIIAEDVVRLRGHDQIMAKEIASLRSQPKASEQQCEILRYNNAQKEYIISETGKQSQEEKIRVAQLEKELKELKNKVAANQQAVLVDDVSWKRKRINRLKEETKNLTAKNTELISHNSQLESKIQSGNKKLQSKDTQLKAMSAAMEQVNEELKRSRACLEDTKNELEDKLDFTEQRLDRLVESEEQLKAEQADLECELEAANDHNRLLESEVYFSRINDQKTADKQNEHITGLEDKIKHKDALIQQLQQNIVRYQPQAPGQPSPAGANNQPPLCREELERQRKISREAHERASDLESKLDAMKAAMNDKTGEMASLEKEWSARVAEAEGMKRRFHDKDAYITNLETKLEELRGTMENVLGQVSMHQGRKRRRTEGPDFQL